MKARRRDLALRAHRLSQKDFRGAALADKLGIKAENALRSRGELANQLANLGSKVARIEGARLTAPELLLIRTLAGIELDQLERGIMSSANSRDVDRRAGKHRGWCAKTVQQRLSTGSDFCFYSRNGYVGLTQTGWALALTARFDRARRA